MSTRGAVVFGASSISYSRSIAVDVGFREPDRDLDGKCDAVVCEHEALEGFVAQLVVADCRNDERGRFGRRVFLASDDGVRGIGEFRSRLGRARFDILFSRKKLVRADRGDAFEEVGERCEASGRGGARGALIVEGAVSEKAELRAVVRIGVHLTVIQLDRADGLIGRKAREAFGAEAPIAAMPLVLLQPRRDRRG